MNFLRHLTRNRNLFVCDIFLIALSYVMACLTVYRISLFGQVAVSCSVFVVASAIIFVGAAMVSGAYHVYWIYGGTWEYLRLLLACLFASVSALRCHISLMRLICIPNYVHLLLQ